ncbi:MAG: hypothetical protein FD133_1321 [Erysipelotrichaceae bacterium]|nr:MAG: hypothetical protein FD179_1838 [Erysipelotrichaceae bacterium]TXT17559.1 MAG: hypothetical protein FD133_1321 [Erysipelotrichaceae bacterium]
MSDIKNLIMNKNGIVSMTLAKIIIQLKVGDRIPTFSELSEQTNVARGTLQNAMKLLQTTNAVTLESRGHLGTFLMDRNMKLLLEFANIFSLVGVMPLPYSNHLKGLATGIISAMENEYDIPVNMAYMRGARKRLSLMMEGRYDFTLASKLAVNDSIQQGTQLQIIKEFGPKTYLSNHVIVFGDANTNSIEDGMRIGIDNDSTDQANLTYHITKDHKVRYVNLNYNQILNKLSNGEIDAAVWNEDEIKESYPNIHYKQIEGIDENDTVAVIVANKNTTELCTLLTQLIDVDTVLSIQHLVDHGKMIPRY